MKIHIEYWIKEKRFSIQVNKLISESIICYKHGAYRASLLFSYLGFITYLKEVIIQASKPDAIPQGRWTTIQNELQDDDKWEKRVFEELVNSSSPIFDIKEDLRQQIKYWKDRRNDCAHFKNNEILSHSIETFWSFLKSNLNKITIEGGKASLIKKFGIHFDYTKTPPNSDYEHLIREIEPSVDLSDFKSFLEDIQAQFDPYDFFEGAIPKIFSKILELCSDDYSEILIEHIKTKNLDLEFISKNPAKINSMGYEASDIREIWKTRLFNHNNDRFIFEIYVSLIRNNLIPEEQLEEAFNQLFDKYQQTSHHFPYDPVIKSGLVNKTFGEVIHKKAIEENELKSFMWVNSKCDIIAFYIESFPLQADTVEKICEMMNYSNYSYWLEEKLNYIFNENPSLKTTFHDIANKNEVSIPDTFK